MDKRIIQTEMASEDAVIEKGLRPQKLDQYIGQEKAKNNLKIFIEAAKKQKRTFRPCVTLWRLRDWVKPPFPLLLPTKWE